MRKNLKKIADFLVAVVGIGGLFSCNKLAGVSEPDTSTAYCSVILTSDQQVTYTDSSFHISALATFRDSVTKRLLSMGNLVITSQNGAMMNTRTITPNPDHTYQFFYDSTSSTQAEGQNLAGTTVGINTTGVSAADTASISIYMPKSVVRYTSDFPIGQINRLNNLTLSWIPDAGNVSGNVLIKIWYVAGLSRFQNSDSTLPTQDKTLTYIVPDNGSYTISTSDLQGFQVNSLIWISLGRASQAVSVLPVSQRKVYYFAVSSASTNALYVRNSN